jgi:hypothetical protein
MAATLKRVDRSAKAKQKQAERITKRMGCFVLEHCPRTFTSDFDKHVEKKSQGHLFYLRGSELTEFPDFPFEVWVDDRDNNGDLAQTVADTLFSIATKYMEVAQRVTLRLNRVPVIREVL